MRIKLAIAGRRPWVIAVAAASVSLVVSLLVTLAFTFNLYASASKLTIQGSQVSRAQVVALDRDLHRVDTALSNPVLRIATYATFSHSTHQHLLQILEDAQTTTALALSVGGTPDSSVINLDSLELLSAALPKVDAALAQLADLHMRGLFYPSDFGLNSVRSQAARFHDASAMVAPLAPVIPELLGSKSPKRYLLAFQNSAEARGTGGIIGAYAVLTFDKGKFTVTNFGSNSNLRSLNDTPIPMPAEFVRLYNDDPGIWQNSNLSPHFPYGAQIWLALWQRQFGQRLDGVFTFDPKALSSLLEITGPVVVDGTEINADNAVKVTLSDLYQLYTKDNLARKQFLVEVIRQVAKRLDTSQTGDLPLAKAMIDPLLEHRVLIYSANPAIQSVIEGSSISGSVTTKIDNDYRLIIQNTSGNKMDYYLGRSLKLESQACGPKKVTKVTFSLKNNVSANTDLPNYVKGRLDLGRVQGLKNSHGTRAIVMAPVGAQLIAMKDYDTGGKFGFFIRERGHPGVGVQVDLQAGQSHTFSLTFKGGEGKLATTVQPLVREQLTEIKDGCGNDR